MGHGWSVLQRRSGADVQSPAVGCLAMAGAVFDPRASGRGAHLPSGQRRGGRRAASRKRSISLPEVRAQKARLGAALAWPGAL